MLAAGDTLTIANANASGIKTTGNVGAADALRTPGTYSIGASDYGTGGSGSAATFTVVIAVGGGATIVVTDDGAKEALKKGKSLLAAGIKNVYGKFNKGDHVKILDKNKEECARGLSSFSSSEINKIKGHHSSKIQDLLGYITKSEVVHKDDMVEI